MSNRIEQPNKTRLSILSAAERSALYEIPDFDHNQRIEYFTFSKQERIVIFQRKGLKAQIYCALQLGYFKAKQWFFNFTWRKVPKKDLLFIMQHYFPGKKSVQRNVTKHENYAQQIAITKFFNYKLWSKPSITLLQQKITQIIQQDISPNFIVTALVSFLKQQQIVRPKYTVFQTIISNALTVERNRLGKILIALLTDVDVNRLKTLLVKKDTLSNLAALKQDAKNFNYSMMVIECQKQTTLKPLYQIANNILPKLNISKHNIEYYASLAHYYTIHDLRKYIKFEQTALYLLCYAWQRYQQLNDNLINAFCYHTRKLEQEIKESTKKQFAQIKVKEKYDLPTIGSLLLLFVDYDTIANKSYVEKLRKLAFEIMSEDLILATAKQMCKPVSNKMDLLWKNIDQSAYRYKKNLRPLLMALDFSSSGTNRWLSVINKLKSTFLNKEKIINIPIDAELEEMIPKSLRPYIISMDDQGKPVGLNANRYEIWIYRQLRKRFNSGELYLQDSIKYRFFDHELVSLEQKEEILKTLNIPWFQTPLDQQLQKLTLELKELWLTFNDDLVKGKLGHIEYDVKTKIIICRKIKMINEEQIVHKFYSKLPLCDIADVLRLVNEETKFLSALAPLQPRYLKHIITEDSLIAVLIAQGMNHGNLKISEISDIPLHELDEANEQCYRLATLKAANDLISNYISTLSIFPYYSLDLMMMYGGSDGQKFETKRPTTKAQNSKKYFKNGKGVVAYTMLANHVPLQSDIIGAHEHEGHYAFDIWYNNTCNIIPNIITGDMHILNKCNFFIFYCFGSQLKSRFTTLQIQLKHLYCGDHLDHYEDCLIKPVGVINSKLIMEEKLNIDRIIASLAVKEITQSTLIRKLCNYNQNSTRKAIFEFEKLVRSIYTLQYLRDPKLQRTIHKSQNRVEGYHQLRAAIAQVGGRKELTGRTDIAIEISNQCGRLIANAIICYNSIILSKLLEKYKDSGNKKILTLIKKISPVAWQHLHFSGHYNFNVQKVIDIDRIIADLIFAEAG